MEKKFVCLQCGRCCSEDLLPPDETTKELIGKTEKEEKGPVYIQKNHGYGLSILDFEKIEIQKKADQFNIKLEIVPVKYCIDLKTKTKIVLSWKIKFKRCPFLLEKNRCLIYNSRPMICRRWPLIPTERGYKSSKHCSAIKKISNKPDFDNMHAAIFFKKQLLALNQQLYMIAGVNALVKKLEQEKNVDLVQGITQEEILKKFKIEKTQGIFEFTEEQKIADSKELIKGLKEKH